jgi:hypothetical protein
MTRNENNEVSHAQKLDMIEAIMRVFKGYKLTIETLFLAVSLINYILPRMANKQKIRLFCKFNWNEQMKLITLISISLAAKYQERISFQVSNLAKSLGFMSLVSSLTAG